jgi:hypothetical protein
MVMILYCHFAWVWHDTSWTALFRFEWLVLDFFGPMMFVTLSMVGNLVRFTAQGLTGKKPGHDAKSLLRIAFLFIIGEILNLYTVGAYGIYHVTEWNVITTIALFSLIQPYILRLPQWLCVALAAAITITYYPLLQLILNAMTPLGVDISNITQQQLHNPVVLLYWLLFEHGMMTPIYSWLVVPLLAPVIFSGFLRAYHANDAARMRTILRKIGMLGCALISCAVALGYQLVPGYVKGYLAELDTPGLYFVWPWPQGMPVILVEHTPQYIFYNLGIVLVIFHFLGKSQVLHQKKLRGEDKIATFGSMSLSAFILSDAPRLVPIKLSMPIFFVIFIPLLIAIIYVFYIDKNRWNQAGSLEWFQKKWISLFMRRREPPVAAASGTI